MATITEDYVSFETAKLLKEKGFDVPCYMAYVPTNKKHIMRNDAGHSNSMHPDDYYAAPTLQMAMKWLREVHKLEIYPFHDTIQENNNWWFRVEKHTKGCGITLYESDSIYLKFEEACEIAIKYCLENLI